MPADTNSLENPAIKLLSEHRDRYELELKRLQSQLKGVESKINSTEAKLEATEDALSALGYKKGGAA